MAEPTTELSLFYKILVYVEDQERVTIRNLESLGSLRQVLGALGRLEGLGYLDRIQWQGEDYLVLSEKGDAAIASIINTLSTSDSSWDEKWRLILFDIPESKRAIRQMLRLKLLNLGARMLQSSVWITPSAPVSEAFSHYLQTVKLNEHVFLFETSLLSSHALDIAAVWNLDQVAEEYQTLFNRFNKQYRALAQSETPSFEAKCMILELALVAQKDPQLPAKLMPRQWIGLEAHNWYKKLRVYCK